MKAYKLELLDIFSYSCMNCIRSLGYIKKLDARYKKYGLKTFIVHVPEWGFEKDKGNISEAIKRNRINFPVKIDSDKYLVDRLKVDFWPSQLLVKNGSVVYRHIGEGNYKALENSIKKYLKIKGKNIFTKELEYPKFPAVYAGKRKKGKISETKDGDKSGVVYVDGRYRQEDEFLEIKGSLSILKKGKIVNFVAESASKKPVKVHVKVNGKSIKAITICRPGLYRIMKSKSDKAKTLALTTNKNLRVYSFSFE